MMPQAITIGGSDPSSGAGIQADLKTISSLGVFGFTIITAITVQNSLGVQKVYPLSTSLVLSQLEAILEDYRPKAIKISLIPTQEMARELAYFLHQKAPIPIVYDPLLISGKGDPLFLEKNCTLLKEAILPLCTLLTPNIPEGEILSQVPIGNQKDRDKVGKKLLQLGPKGVFLKGGHEKKGRKNKENSWIQDSLYLPDKTYHLIEPLLPIPNIHGTGCTLASAITAYLAKGNSLEKSVLLGRKYVYQKLPYPLYLGRGDPVLPL